MNCSKIESEPTRSEGEMQKEHIEGGAAGYGEQHIAEEEVDDDAGGNAQQLRCTVHAVNEVHVLYAVNTEHTEDSTGQPLAKERDETRHLRLPAENKEDKRTGEHHRGCHQCYSYYLLSNCHFAILERRLHYFFWKLKTTLKTSPF